MAILGITACHAFKLNIVNFTMFFFFFYCACGTYILLVVTNTIGYKIRYYENILRRLLSFKF
jgi:hypothetical protein